MERLIAFGCSLTFGHGLPDCFIPPKHPGYNHSQFAWPTIVSKFMNRQCLNLSSPGSSNKRIWYNVMNFDYKENDIVFIQWSFVDRSAVIHKTGITDIGHWIKGCYYEELHDEFDATVMSKLFVEHANTFLQSKNIKVYNLVPTKKEIEILKFKGPQIDHIPVYFFPMKYWYPKALDTNHPGIECQEVFSKEILKYLNIENDLPVHKKMTIFQKIREKINAV